MPDSAPLPVRVAILAALLSVAGASTLPAQEQIGVTSAVNPAATGAAPGAAPRRLEIGENVIFNEHITTTEAGQTQLLFVDQSSMTIGPNSDLTIDQFVYDPKSGTGKLAMSATRGLLRYVGGKLSKQDDGVTLRTATATLAVRGGAFFAQVNPDGTTEVAFIYGKGLTITGATGVSETLYRPGFAVTIAPGAAPSRPAPVPPGRLALYTQRLDGIAGKTGGAKTIPTNATVANSGISQTVSGNFTESVEQATQNQGTTQSNPQLAAVPTVVQNTVGSTASQGAQQQVIAAAPPPPSITPPPVVVSTLGGGFYSTAAGASGVTVGFAAPAAPYATGSINNGIFSVDGSFGQVTFPLAVGSATLSASGAGTQSPLGPVTGTTYYSPDGSFFYANLTPVNSPTQNEFIYGGTPVNQSFLNATSGTPNITAFTVNPDAALRSAIPFITQATGGSVANPVVSPLYLSTPANNTFSTTTAATKALQGSLAISGSGAQQSSSIVVLVGNVFNAPQPSLQGVIQSSYLANATSQPIRNTSYYQTPIDGNGNSFYGGNTLTGFALSPGAGTTSAVSVNTANQAATNYQFAQALTATALPAAVGSGTQTTQTLSGYFGGIMTAQTTTPTGASGLTAPLPYILSGQSSISTNATNGQLSATLTGGDPFTAGTSGIPANNGMVLQFGSLTTGATSARQAFISDNLFGALESPTTDSTVNGVTVPVSTSFPGTNPNIYLVTQTVAPPTALLPNGMCTCQYLQWGYWGGEIDTPASGSIAARTDVGNINFWVAGTPTSVSDLNTLAAQAATGTYTGSAIGTVFNNGSTYLASGGFAGNYNFGTQSGTMTISNFDGHTISATGHFPLTGANYTFAVAQTGVAGTINGTFYGPKAVETAGNFAVHSTIGPTYLASGIFAGKQ